MLVWETFGPQDSTNLYNYPAVIFGDSFASRTILLTVRGVNVHTSLSRLILNISCRFKLLNYFHDSGVFSTISRFSYVHFLICAAQQLSDAHVHCVLGSFP